MLAKESPYDSIFQTDFKVKQDHIEGVMSQGLSFWLTAISKFQNLVNKDCWMLLFFLWVV
jgi:hypothetical protein